MTESCRVVTSIVTKTMHAGKDFDFIIEFEETPDFKGVDVIFLKLLFDVIASCRVMDVEQ